ncbi:acyl-CoA dehydrogenase family protein [Streptomyces sp. O3]
MNTVDGTSESAVQERIARLEQEFGDFDDPGNPLGAQQFLAADSRQRPLPAAERLLDSFELNAEFVPGELGGRLGRLDVLARVLRAVFRRDAALGLGYGLTSYLAAAVVWAGGSTAQRRQSADVLLAGGRMAGAYPEPPQGNDFLRNRLTATPDGDGYLLSGRKDALNNAGRAQALVVFAHTPDGLSAFLAPGPTRPGGGAAGGDGGDGGLAVLPRRRTLGVRGCLIQGVAFDGHRLEPGRLIGERGGGARLTELVFPLTRSAGLSMALGCADTALRTTAAFARAHRSRSRASLRSSRTRGALVNAFADLLVCDCLALVATRAVHLLPRESGTLSAVAKYLLPSILSETMDDLSVVLGAEAYATSGSYGIFQKTTRDLSMIGLGSAGASASRAVLIAQLLRLPSLAAPGHADEVAGLFRPFDADLPSYGLQDDVRAADRDSLLDSLEESARQAASGAAGEFGPLLAQSAALLVDQARALREACAELAAQPAEGPVSPRAYALAERYALIVAGAACLGVWRHRPAGGFLADPVWAAMALARIACRLDKSAPRTPPSGEDALLAELLDRFDDARSYDLYATAIGG